MAKVGRPQGTNTNVRTNTEKSTTSDDQSIPHKVDVLQYWESFEDIINTILMEAGE